MMQHIFTLDILYMWMMRLDLLSRWIQVHVFLPPIMLLLGSTGRSSMSIQVWLVFFNRNKHAINRQNRYNVENLPFIELDLF